MADERAKRNEADRRRAPRFNISMPVTVTDPATGRTYPATVDNISLGGVLLLIDTKLESGTRLFINLPIADDMTMRIEVSLVRRTNVGEFGVAFVSLTDGELDRLADFFEMRSTGVD